VQFPHPPKLADNLGQKKLYRGLKGGKDELLSDLGGGRGVDWMVVRNWQGWASQAALSTASSKLLSTQKGAWVAHFLIGGTQENRVGKRPPRIMRYPCFHFTQACCSLVMLSKTIKNEK